MILDFYIDYEEDLNYVMARLTHLDPAGLEERMRSKELDVQVVKKILQAPDREQKFQILDGYLKDFYKTNLDGMQWVRSEYTRIWSGKKNDFFTLVGQLMGEREWKYDNYHFLVGSFFSRAQWGKGNRLAVWWMRDPEKYWFLNGYELIISHIFEIVDQTYEQRPVSDWHIWALAEAIAYILVYRDERLKTKFWPQLKEPEKFGYPQLLKHINYLDENYRKVQNFDDFLTEAIGYIKQFTHEHLTQPF